MKRLAFVICGLVLCLNYGGVYSQVTIYGGKGLCRVLSAEPIKPTDIFVNGTASLFIEKTGPETLAKYYCANLNTTVGLAEYLEVFLNLVPYQDDQRHILGRIGDTKIGLKYLTPLSLNTFKFAVMGFYKFPTAEVSNVPYEIFSTSKPGWGAKALFTIDFLDVSPTFPIKLDINLGYMDHNIYDRYFEAKIDQLLIGTGAKFSIRSAQVYVEYTGEIFFNNPGQVDFSQNSMRITPGIRLLAPWRNTLDLACDVSLTNYDSHQQKDQFHKEYFHWKITVGITHHFSVYKYFDKTARLEKQKRLEEQKKLEAIKKKRENANKDLEKMKEMLDKKKSEES